MKSRRKSFIICTTIGIVSFFLFACATGTSNDYQHRPLSELTVDEIRKMIESGSPFQAVQDISALERESKNNQYGLSSRDLRELYNMAIAKTEELFNDAVENKDFSKAISIYKSGKTLEIAGRFREWGEKELYIALTEEKIEKGEVVPALSYVNKAIEAGSLTEKECVRFGTIALKEKQWPTVRKIIAHMKRQSFAVPAAFEKANERSFDSAQMLKGTVTVWVDRGMKIEQGVGYPDRVIGSGFFIDERGYILTNYHVIASEVDPTYEGFSRLYIRLSDDKDKRIPAEVVGYDKIFDIALLKTQADPQYVFPLSERAKFEPGEKIFAIGSPVGLANTITSGIVSATGRRFLQLGDAIQVDVPVNPGNSGGPLVNQHGELIGIVFAGLEQFEGINFAIPTHWVNDILPELYEGGEVEHPWLGMAVYKEGRRMEVLYCLPGGPAYRAGLRNGDIVQSINGVPFSEIGDIQQFLITLTAQSIVKITWQRGESTQSGMISLDRRPYHPMDIALDRDLKERLFIPLFGFVVEETAELFWENNYIVKKVYPGSIADETGISVNDPFSIIRWFVDKENRLAFLQIFIKKRKAGFLQKGMQMAAYLEVNYFI